MQISKLYTSYGTVTKSTGLVARCWRDPIGVLKKRSYPEPTNDLRFGFDDNDCGLYPRVLDASPAVGQKTLTETIDVPPAVFCESSIHRQRSARDSFIAEV